MKKHHKTILIVVVYFIVLYRLSYAVMGKLEEKETLAVIYINKAFDLDANNDLWKDIAPVGIHLLPQSARTPHGTTERDILVRMAHNNEEIAVLIEFNDESEDRTGPANPDACAVLFAPGDAPATAQMMGFGSIANVWQWLADRDARKYQAGEAAVNVVRELFARGPGTQKELPGQNVEGRGWLQRGRLINVGRKKSFGLAKKWPKELRNLWPLTILFFVTTFFSAFFTVRPLASFILLAIIIGFATFISVIYEKRTFCLFFCPVSGFQGLYANFAASEVRVKDPAICKKHTPKTCVVGNENGYGCP